MLPAGERGGAAAPGMRFTICPISSPKTRGSGGEHTPSPSPSHSGRCQKVITARGRGGQHSVIIMTIKHPEHSGGFQIALSLSPQCHSEGCCVALLSGRWLEAGRENFPERFTSQLEEGGLEGWAERWEVWLGARSESASAIYWLRVTLPFCASVSSSVEWECQVW